MAQRLDSAGSVLGTYAFDAYSLRTGTDATTDPYAGFGGGYGYYADAETGLSLLGHRYYDAGTGRFLNRDPLGYAGGADLYAYCGNNPVMAADPSGTSALSDWYWGGMGGLTSLVDEYALGGSMANLGTVTGKHDAGCASDLDVAKAGANLAGNVIMTVMPGGEEARGAEIGEKALVNLAEDGNGIRQAIRPHRELVEDFNKNPQDWEMTSAQAGKAINRNIKGGINIEGQWRNKITDEELSSHQGLGGPGNGTSIHPENDGPNLPGGGSIRPRNQAKEL